MLPSPEIFERRAAGADFSVVDRHAFGRDYALTLAHWQRNFEAAWPEIAAQGFDTRFRRLWRFYLAYCEAGFRAEATDVYHFVLEKPRT
jgi:cyclopropane-fatty-acyl-phospholipid synthase